jgi:hypothetical protein
VFRRLQLELLEDRTLLAITPTIPNPAPAWTDLGPTTIIDPNGISNQAGMGNQQKPTAGAVVAFAAAPNNPSVVFAATANGGIWKTVNINQTATVDVNQFNNPSLAAGC